MNNMRTRRTLVTPPMARRGWRRLKQAVLGASTVAEGWDDYAYDHGAPDPAEATHLGDEWSHYPGWEEHLFETLLRPRIGEREVIIEIGCGGGRFTELLLRLAQERVIATDTSRNMLRLTTDRFADEERLQCVLLDGKGLRAIGDDSADALFSYGVFVHLQHWDIFNYLKEAHRVLRTGAPAVIHHANTLSELGWKQFLMDMPPSLNKHKLMGSFSVMTPDLMRAFAERAGLDVLALDTETARRDCIAVLTKPE